MEQNLNIEMTEESLRERLRKVTQEIREAEEKVKEVDRATEAVLAKIAKNDEQTRIVQEKWNKTNELLEKYSSALDKGTKAALGKTVKIDEETRIVKGKNLARRTSYSKNTRTLWVKPLQL